MRIYIESISGTIIINAMSQKFETWLFGLLNINFYSKSSAIVVQNVLPEKLNIIHNESHFISMQTI